MKRHEVILLFMLGLAPLVVLSARGGVVAIDSTVLSVQVDSAFPRIVQYQWKADGSVFYGQEDSLSRMMINGQELVPKITFLKTKSQAHYVASFKELDIVLKMEISAQGNVVEFRVTDIQENGITQVKTIEIPDHSLLSIRETQANAQLTSTRLWPRAHAEEYYEKLSAMAVSTELIPRTYVILNTENLAASIDNNVLLDSDRFFYQVQKKGSSKNCAVQNGVWTYREIESEMGALPFSKIVITADANDDQQIDWQDGGLAHRQIMESFYGADTIRSNVVCYIGMNFASLAQQPFLRTLDHVKKVYLYTDGLPQAVLLKGYQSEGHDSAHPDYGDHFNERAGGVKDLNILADAGKKYKVSLGVHINQTESYPEAKAYSDTLVTDKRAWAWLDQSFKIDQRTDILSGNLYKRLDELNDNVPGLSWVYVDAYFGVGWDAMKLAEKLNECGWRIATEHKAYFERYVTWIHGTGHGIPGQVMRFIRNHQRDTWASTPLLPAAENKGFIGWGGERDLPRAIKDIFVNNLPAKFAQHFELTKWTDTRADFDGEFYVQMEGKNACMYRNNKKISSGLNIFIPWDPVNETKIYHWNSDGGKSKWELPNRWAEVKRIKLYKLTDLGRVFVGDLPVKANRVSLDTEQDVPYVLYKSEPAARPDMQWGEGGLVKDPGFDSHGFRHWTPASPTKKVEHITIENNELGQTHLKVTDRDGGVSQTLSGLKGGQTYAASVWVQLQGKGQITLGVKGVDSKEQICTVNKTDVPNYSNNSAKHLTNYQRLKVYFDVPVGKSTSVLYLNADQMAAGAVAEFDDVRVVAAKRSSKEGCCFFEDFENTDQGWGPFIYGYKGKMKTHLSETHEGYTTDTINGRFSLKTKNEKPGLIYRSTPALLPLKANTTYSISFEYLADHADQYSVAIRTDDGGTAQEKLNRELSQGSNQFSATFTTGNYDDYYVGVVKNTPKKGNLIIDDFLIDTK
jgi:endo-alpha-N-acetylgalactosaminidase